MRMDADRIFQPHDVRAGSALGSVLRKSQRAVDSTGMVARARAVVLPPRTSSMAHLGPHVMGHRRRKPYTTVDHRLVPIAPRPLAAAIFSGRNHVFRARDAIVPANE